MTAAELIEKLNGCPPDARVELRVMSGNINGWGLLANVNSDARSVYLVDDSHGQDDPPDDAIESLEEQGEDLG